MEKFKPPFLDKNIICITSNDADLELISAVSCYFNKPNFYFPIFRLSTTEYQHNQSSSAGDDDYITNSILKKACTLILNCAARIKCRCIILVGISDLQKTFLNLDKYFKVKVIEINQISEIDEKLKELDKKFDGIVYCKKNQIGLGLIKAKRSNKRLVVDENASIIDEQKMDNGKGLIVIESDNDISDIIIANYASSLDADVRFIKVFQTEELKNIMNLLIKWKSQNSYGAFLSLSNIINGAIRNIDIEKYSYITFFTDGVPYGILFNSIIPCSHVLRSVSEDVFIFNNILFEQDDLYIGSSVIFSPQPDDLGEYPKLESSIVDEILDKHKYLVKKLANKEATVNAFDFYVSHYPYDLLHICSHGGEIDGYYVIQDFMDRDGKKHTIEYEEVVGFSPDGESHVKVVSKKIFKFLDGFIWRSEELKKQQIPKYVYEDMAKAISNEGIDKTISRKKMDYPIEGSCHIKCYDDIHQGQFHSIASQRYPFIFNNSCTSWKEFSTHLIAGGCRAYIGTLWSVGNELAFKSGALFYNHAFNNCIINAFNIMVNDIDDERYKDIYIFCGMHFSTIKGMNYKSDKRLKNEMINSLQRWIDYIKKQNNDELLNDAINVTRFLSKELTPYFQDPYVMQLIIKSMRVCGF